MMRSVRFDQFGEPAEVLRVLDVPKPSPGLGQVLVRMRLRPINPSDLMTVRGFYGVLPQLPATPGNEGVGVIEAVGSDVRGVQAGQRVIPIRTPGTWQEYLVVNAAQLIQPPDSLSDESAAQFIVNPLTAWIMIEELALQPGQWLLQTAAGSTLGRMVLQIAKLRNFKTINVVRRRAQAQELKALGADEVICTEDEDLVQRVMAITNGAGVLAAIDAVGGQVGGDVVQALDAGGVMLVYGLLSLEPTPINSGQMIFRTSTVRGFWLAEWFRRAPAEKRQAVIGEVLNHMAKGEIIPAVEAEYDLNKITEAVRHAERPGRHGKILLVG
jgi:NADPH:quinone reductase-like Zn-dependent oxidoreductase